MYVYRYAVMLLSGCQSVGVCLVYLITSLICERHSINVIHISILYTSICVGMYVMLTLKFGREYF